MKFATLFSLALFAALATVSMPAAQAADCGHPNALGTSRTIAIDPKEHPAIGQMMYPESLPLADHEVVLTFDDGPLLHKTNTVLDELAAECVKATFFIIGRMANEYPDIVKRIRADGHTIGTHTQNHLLKLAHLPLDEARKEIDDGIASTAAAAGAPGDVAPFIRLPGLRFSDEIEGYAKSEGLMIWSSDVVADDWRRISPKKVLSLALERLDKRGRGILLLHDIQKRTGTMLPQLLAELKRRHYKIVHVVPADADHAKTATNPEDWLAGQPTAKGKATGLRKFDEEFHATFDSVR